MTGLFRTRRSPSWISALPALLLAASACGPEPLGPPRLAGDYTLSQAAGQPLPATVFDGTIHDPSGGTPDFRLQVVTSSGSLTLTHDGHYEHAVDLTPAIDGIPQTVTHWHDHGQYTQEGDSLRFVSDFIENVHFVGVAVSGRLELEQDLAGEGYSARYLFEHQ